MSVKRDPKSIDASMRKSFGIAANDQNRIRKEVGSEFCKIIMVVSKMATNQKIVLGLKRNCFIK